MWFLLVDESDEIGRLRFTDDIKLVLDCLGKKNETNSFLLFFTLYYARERSEKYKGEENEN